MPSQTPRNGPLLPWIRVTEDAYALTAARTFTVDRSPGGTLRLSGPCPRCGTWFTLPVVSETVRGRTNSRSGYVTVMCGCEEPHPQRPANRTGCGAYWNLTVEEAP